MDNTLYQLFEILLVTNVARIELFNVKITDELKDHLLIVFKEHKEIFSDIETSIKKILADNKINGEDIPEMLKIVGKLYETFYKSKHIKKKWDYYELTKSLLHISLVLYIHDKNIENKEIINPIINIIDSAIDLVKLKSDLKMPLIKVKFW